MKSSKVCYIVFLFSLLGLELSSAQVGTPASPCAICGESPISVHIDVAAPKGGINPLSSVKFRLHNYSPFTIFVSKWFTPLESLPALMANCMSVRSVADPTISADYTGAISKRDMSGVMIDSIVILPGHYHQVVTDLSLDYRAVIEGDYSLQFVGNVTLRAEGGDVHTFFLTSNTITVYLSPDFPHREFDDQFPKLTYGGGNGAQSIVPMSDCSSSEASTVTNAIYTAQSQSKNALAYEQSSCATDAPYVTWYGSPSNSRAAEVRTTWSSIYSNLAGLSFSIVCGGDSCSPFTYAYVYPTQTATKPIHLCGAFWNAPSAACETDSQPGTLSHEMSHFNDVGATNDYAYGQADCKQLAKTNPNRAVNNADNYEYFQEGCYEC